MGDNGTNGTNGTLCREIGKRLRARRVALGWSLAGVALRMDVREASVSRWERGDRCLDVHTLYRLGSALGCDPRELLPDPTSDGAEQTARAVRRGLPPR